MVILTGRNTVLEALRIGRRVRRIYLSLHFQNNPKYRLLLSEAKKKGVEVRILNDDELRRICPKIRQGIAAEAEDFSYADFDSILAENLKISKSMMAFLDGLEDPQNLGNILRTAGFIGASGIVLRKKRSVQVTPVVERISQGAALTVPVARVSNLRSAVLKAKEAGFWVVGLEADGDIILKPEALPEKCAFVIGGEDTGISRLVREECDYIVKIEGSGAVSSLNAASAFAVASYCWKLRVIKDE
jgi:23S rRNA (guanosine2251-2'-O)-methyltransferase